MPGPSNYDPIRDGYATLIQIGVTPLLALYEREVTVAAAQGGGPIESTTMRNLAYRTKDPKTLKQMGDLMATVCSTTTTYQTIEQDLINEPTFCLVAWPDGSTLKLYGYVDQFSPAGFSEGNLPTFNLLFIVTNRDPTTGEESPPEYTAGVGAPEV